MTVVTVKPQTWERVTRQTNSISHTEIVCDKGLSKNKTEIQGSSSSTHSDGSEMKTTCSPCHNSLESENREKKAKECGTNQSDKLQAAGCSQNCDTSLPRKAKKCENTPNSQKRQNSIPSPDGFAFTEEEIKAQLFHRFKFCW